MMASRPPLPLTGPRQSELDWLLKAGIEIQTLIYPEPMRIAAGYRAEDGLFEPDAAGPRWLAFDELLTDDIVLWQPRLGSIASWTGRAFALGEEIVDEAATYCFDCNLNIFADPMDWLLAGRDGIVVLDWSRAFDRLRDAPRIAIAETLLHTYQRVMKPSRMPELFVIPDQRRAAA